MFVGELDQLVSAIPHAHLITCPVIGPPAVAKKGQLVIMMSGEYQIKKQISYLIVPAVGRKVIDLGENLEKGIPPDCEHYIFSCITFSANLQAYW